MPILLAYHSQIIILPGKPDSPWSPNKLKVMKTTCFSLSLCSYVFMYWLELFCLKALVLSARIYVLDFQDYYTFTKWNILSDQIKYIACSLAHIWAERIFHFGRVCWSWKINTYIQAERTRALRQNISEQYIHTNRENKPHFTVYEQVCLIVSNQVSCHKLEKLNSWLVCDEKVIKNSNIRVLDNFPKLFPKPKSITFIPHNLKQEWKAWKL